MITYTMSTITGTRLPCEPVTAEIHVAKPWQYVVVLGGLRLDDNNTGVSAHRRRHE